VVDELDENTSDSRVREQWASGSATRDLMVSKTRDDFAYGVCWPNPVDKWDAKRWRSPGYTKSEAESRLQETK
jgi:hypothetical protein